MKLINKEKIKRLRDEHNFLDQWKEIMYHTNLYNAGNQTFNLLRLQQEEYGYSAVILPPYGYSFENLETIRPIIQDNLGCMFINKINDSKKSSYAKFVTKKFNSGIYIPIKTEAYELYLGKSMDKKDYIVNMYKYPHVLLTGVNNSGKSRMLDCIITTLINNFNNREIMLFFIQLAKNDLIIYEDCKQCYAFADNLSDAETILKYINDNVLKKRSELVKPIRKSGRGNSIIDYNKIHPENKQPIVYVIFDEMSTIMDTNCDINEIKKIKQYLVLCAEHIAQYGRALCVYGIFCLQRATRDNLSPFVKSQSNTRISFRQNNKISSMVAMDDDEIAYQLPMRIAVVENDSYEYLKVPKISDKTIFKYITSSLKPNHRNLFRDLKIIQIENQDYEEKYEIKDNQKEIKKDKKSKSKNKLKDKRNKNNIISEKFDKVDPRILEQKQEKLINNIKKIPNFVPYNKNINVKVIDKTHIDFSKTEKPKKIIILNNKK